MRPKLLMKHSCPNETQKRIETILSHPPFVKGRWGEFQVKRRLLIVVILLITALGCYQEIVMAAEDGNTSLAVIQKKLAEHFSFDFRILTFGIIQEPSNSSQNPENNFLQLPHYLADLEIRPDNVEVEESCFQD